MKAITPVIAIIVLLLITVAIAGAAWTYISGYWSGTTGKQVEVTDAFCVGTDQAKILVKNIGTESLNTGEIRVMDKASGSDISDETHWMVNVPDPSLVLEMKFDEGSGNVAMDASGTGNHGNVNGNPQWTNGRAGKALDLDGSGDFAQVPDSPSLRLGIQQTAAAWIKVKANPIDFSRLVGKGNITHRNYGLWRAADGDLIYQFYSAGSYCNFQDNAGPGSDSNIPADSKWYHVAGTYDGTTGRLYINGTEVHSSTCTAIPYITDDPLTIGFVYYHDYFNGTIDEVRVYSRALSGSEIRALAEYSYPLPPGETATLTHTCNGRCDYRILLGGVTKAVAVQC